MGPYTTCTTHVLLLAVDVVVEPLIYLAAGRSLPSFVFAFLCDSHRSPCMCVRTTKYLVPFFRKMGRLRLSLTRVTFRL